MTKEQAAELVKEFVDNNVAKLDWHGNEVRVQRILDFPVVHDIITSIVDQCFGTDSSYTPDVKDYLIRLMIISAYTDVEIPDDAAMQYALVYATDLYDDVVQCVSDKQLSEIFSAIDALIEYRIRVNTDTLTSGITELYGKIQSMTEDFGKLYSELSPEDMKRFVQAVSKTKLNEKKLVQAVVESKA